MSGNGKELRDEPEGGEDADGEEQSNVQRKAEPHGPSLRAARALAEEGDSAEEEAAWEALRARLQAMGCDPRA